MFFLARKKNIQAGHRRDRLRRSTTKQKTESKMHPIAEQIWDMKYRLHGADGTPRDLTVADTWSRVATALAQAEAPEERDAWTARFREAFGLLLLLLLLLLSLLLSLSLSLSLTLSLTLSLLLLVSLLLLGTVSFHNFKSQSFKLSV